MPVLQSRLWIESTQAVPSYDCDGELNSTGVMVMKGMLRLVPRGLIHSLHGGNDLRNQQHILWKTTSPKPSVNIISLNLQLNTSIISKMSNLLPCLRISWRREPALTVWLTESIIFNQNSLCHFPCLCHLLQLIHVSMEGVPSAPPGPSDSCHSVFRCKGADKNTTIKTVGLKGWGGVKTFTFGGGDILTKTP